MADFTSLVKCVTKYIQLANFWGASAGSQLNSQNQLSQPSPQFTLPLTAFLIASTISRLGNFLAALAIPWFVLATTGSATNTALTVAVGTVPLIITGVFGGALVDRFGYWRSSVLSEIASGISTLLIPALHFTIGIEFWHLLIFVFLGALLDSPGNTARRSLFPELVAQTSMSLDRANALFMISGRIAGLVGAPLAGVLVALIGAPSLLFITTGGFALSSLLFVVFIPRNTSQQEHSQPEAKSYLTELREGFGFMYRDKLLFWLLLSSSLGSFLAEPLYAVILQVYVQDQYGSAENLGFIFAGLAIGSLIGNAIFVGMSDRLPRRGVFVYGFGIRALAFVVFAFVPSWWVVALAIAVGAIALEPVNPLSQSILQERVPAGMRGRVFGVVSAIQVSTLPIGVMMYGFLLDWMGLQATLIFFVAANLLVPVAFILNPYLKVIDKPRRATENL